MWKNVTHWWDLSRIYKFQLPQHLHKLQVYQEENEFFLVWYFRYSWRTSEAERYRRRKGKEKIDLLVSVGLDFWPLPTKNNFLDFFLFTSNEKNGFTLKRPRSRWYPAETVTVADDLALLANTPTQAKSVLHSLEQAAKGTDLYMSSDKIVHMLLLRWYHLLIK